jgi:DNA polymerase-3 subunit gamma/tau
LFDFRRITIQDTVDHLQEICSKENITADPDALHLIAQKSEGCMRDSLSILDKIVSFTNGRLTYRNTLDHLNILDYDYYFRVMEAVQRQDMAEVLLIVDDILQKGFEGDNFIGGMAEFIRDLLVCRDEKVIQLLEISANLKERYKTLATTMNAALLVSALQLLTDAEINYRQARNKRLLVEITMIKLCYLEQAVSLVSNELTGEVVKKKLTEPAVTQKLRAAFPRPLQAGSTAVPAHPPQEAKLTIVEEKAVPAADIAAAKAGTPATSVPAVADQEPAGNNRLTGLKNLRSKISRQSAANTPVSIVPITPAALEEKWEEYARKLQATNRQNVASNLLNARVMLTGEEEITIVSKNIIQQKFIEEEKIDIAEFLKQALQHPQLILVMQLDEETQEATAMPVVLSGKEQYLRMIEKYPLIKELKDKLNLEIDY